MLAYLFDPAEPELYRERELVRDDRVPGARAMVAQSASWACPSPGSRSRGSPGTVRWGARTSPPRWSSSAWSAASREAFTTEWLANGGRAYVQKHELDPFDAIRLVKGAGGVTVFAHPGAAQARDDRARG